MCHLCAEAHRLLAEYKGEFFAKDWLMNYTGTPFWNGQDTLKEVRLFLALDIKGQEKHMNEIDTGDLDKVVPLYKKCQKDTKDN